MLGVRQKFAATQTVLDVHFLHLCVIITSLTFFLADILINIYVSLIIALGPRRCEIRQKKDRCPDRGTCYQKGKKKQTKTALTI